MKNTLGNTILAAGMLSLSLPAFAAENDQLRNEVDALKKQNRTIMQRLDATMDMLEKNRASDGTSRTSIGGYGELHYNNLENKKPAGNDKNEIDFHRFVLFFGHDFNKDIRFFSELELEHSIAGEGKSGEIELEQAYVEFDINDTTRAKGGLFLVPVGIINETHEPPTFYGVERNPVEKNIVPATWWEAGAALNGQLGDSLSYDLALTSALDLSTANKVRDGRQKVAKANAESGMLTARVKWTGVPGTELAATISNINDYTHGKAAKNSATMIEAHAIYNQGPFALRALYATWDVDGKTSGYDEQTGWYVEPSFKINTKFGVFARYNEWDNQAGDSATDTEYSQIDVGFNYWPHEDVVIKIDVQDQDSPASKDEYDGFNVGIGYQF